MLDLLILICCCENPQELSQVVTECLRVATNDELDSVAFPALGMGGLRYPPYEVSMAMLRAVGQFYVDNPNTTVRTLHIAAFGLNDYSMQVFAESTINFCKEINHKLSEFENIGTNEGMFDVEYLQNLEKQTSLFPPKDISFWGKIRAFFQSSQYPRGELFRVKVAPRGSYRTCYLALRNAYNVVKLQYVDKQMGHSRELDG